MINSASNRSLLISSRKISTNGSTAVRGPPNQPSTTHGCNTSPDKQIQADDIDEFETKQRDYAHSYESGPPSSSDERKGYLRPRHPRQLSLSLSLCLSLSIAVPQPRVPSLLQKQQHLLGGGRTARLPHRSSEQSNLIQLQSAPPIQLPLLLLLLLLLLSRLSLPFSTKTLSLSLSLSLSTPRPTTGPPVLNG